MAAKDRAEKNEADARLAVYGPDAVNYGPESLRGRTEELNLELAGRGRVWEHGQVAVKGNNRVFKFPVARPADEGVGAMQDIKLYAFMDGPVPLKDGSGTVSSPVSFIGTVSVAGETPDSVELEPVFLANEAEFTKPSATWTLFEKMPSDRNDAFHRVEGLDVKDEAFDSMKCVIAIGGHFFEQRPGGRRLGKFCFIGQENRLQFDRVGRFTRHADGSDKRNGRAYRAASVFQRHGAIHECI